MDIAFALEQRPLPDSGAVAERSRKRAEGSGRQFLSESARLYWPHTEVLQRLRSRSKALHLVELEVHREFLLENPYQVLLGSFP